MAYKFDKSGLLQSVTAEELEASGSDGSYVIVLDHGTSSDGRSYWLYIAVKANKYSSFRNLVAQRTTVHFKDYGDILCYGYERQVPPQVKQEMKEKYHVDENYMTWLIQDFENARQAFLKEKEIEDNKRIADIVTMLKNK